MCRSNRVLLALLFFFCSCATSTDSLQTEVLVLKKGDQLIVHNNTGETIYTFIVEGNFAAVINWAPFFVDPLLDGKSRKLQISEIGHSPGNPIKDGNTVIVYWWTKSFEETKQINSTTIIL